MNSKETVVVLEPAKTRPPVERHQYARRVSDGLYAKRRAGGNIDWVQKLHITEDPRSEFANPLCAALRVVWEDCYGLIVQTQTTAQ